MKPRLKKLRLYPLDTVDANTDPKENKRSLLILSHVQLQSSNIVLHPTTDEVQQLMHQLVNYVLKIFHGVRQWGEVREIDVNLIHNYPMHDFSQFAPTNGNAEKEKISARDEEGSRQKLQGEESSGEVAFYSSLQRKPTTTPSSITKNCSSCTRISVISSSRIVHGMILIIVLLISLSLW